MNAPALPKGHPALPTRRRYRELRAARRQGAEPRLVYAPPSPRKPMTWTRALWAAGTSAIGVICFWLVAVILIGSAAG